MACDLIFIWKSIDGDLIFALWIIIGILRTSCLEKLYWEFHFKIPLILRVEIASSLSMMRETCETPLERNFPRLHFIYAHVLIFRIEIS